MSERLRELQTVQYAVRRIRVTGHETGDAVAVKTDIFFLNSPFGEAGGIGSNSASNAWILGCGGVLES